MPLRESLEERIDDRHLAPIRMHTGIERARLVAIEEDEPLLTRRICTAEVGFLGGPTARGAKRGNESETEPLHILASSPFVNLWSAA
jgi:hypothetical protein